MNLTNLPSTELLQNVMMASPNGVLVLQAIRAADGRLIDLYMTLINAVAEQELDCPAVEVLGQSFAQFFPHLAEKKLLEHYRQVLDTGHSFQFETHFFRSPQSSPTWLDVSVVQLEKSLLLTYADITDSKIDIDSVPLTDVLQQSFDESVSGISVFEVIRDSNGQISDFELVMINKAGLQMSGFLSKEILGRTIWEMYPATSINGLFDQYVRVYETGKPVSTQNYYPEYDIWREVKIMRAERGIMVSYNDITVLKKAQETVKQQEQLLEDLLEGISVGMAVVQPVRSEKGAAPRIVNFRIMKANAASETVFGQSPRQVVGQLITDAVGHANVSELLNRCAAAVEQQQVFTMSLRSQLDPVMFRVTMTASGDQFILTFTSIFR
ncbi:PAS domain-containing protein [Spirosoma pollinicola]|nr:PAS domain-containing protein [Spirosoma pollinicola]